MNHPNLQSDTSVLLMRLGAIGEGVTLLPSLYNLTRIIPEKNIHILCEEIIYTLIERDFPQTNHIKGNEIYSDRNVRSLVKPSFWNDLLGLFTRSRNMKFDVFICYHLQEYWTNVLRPHLFTNLFRHRRSFGFDDQLLPNWDVKVRSGGQSFEHIFSRNLRLTEAFTGKSFKTKPWIGISSDRKNIVRDKVNSRFGFDPAKEQILMICAGAADPWRCWPPKKFAELLGNLPKDFPMKYVLIGKGEAENTIANKIVTHTSGTVYNGINLLSLKYLPELIDFSDLFVANDTGPLHMATARQIPTVGLFGPGVLYYWAPYNLDYFTPVYVNKPEDPLLLDHRDDPQILRDISVTDVRQALLNQYDQNVCRN